MNQQSKEEKKDKTTLEKLKDFFKFHFNPENTFEKNLSKELKKRDEGGGKK